MGRLIDADRLLEVLEREEAYHSDIPQRADGIRDAIMDVMSAHTVEAVPVVRCCDCTRWRKYNGEQFGDCKWTFRVTKAEGYCDDAERKDGDDAEGTV